MKGFYQLKTSAATIDAFQAMIWDKPFVDLLPTYAGYFGHFRHLLIKENIVKMSMANICNICISAAKLPLYICY